MVGSPIKFGNLSKDFSNPREKAWREGKSDYAGSIGPNKDFGDEFVQLMAAKHIDVITKLHQAFSELPRGLGRGLSSLIGDNGPSLKNNKLYINHFN